jgi:hypothetical protein
MMPLYAARIEDLGLGDFVKVDCAACHHVALLAQGFLLRLAEEGCFDRSQVSRARQLMRDVRRIRQLGLNGRNPFLRQSIFR